MCIIRVRDGVAQKADGTYNASNGARLAREVTGITHDQSRTCCLPLAADTYCLASIIIHDSRVLLVQHVDATVHSTQPRKGLPRRMQAAGEVLLLLLLLPLAAAGVERKQQHGVYDVTDVLEGTREASVACTPAAARPGHIVGRCRGL